jgi:aldehyde dehydrogenase (NAD(P)+)
MDEAVARLRDAASGWARAPLAARLELAREMLRGAARVSDRLVAAACRAKGLVPGTPPEGEEWIASPFVTLRILRQIVASLECLARYGTTPLGPVHVDRGGRTVARVFPPDPLEAALFLGVRGEVHCAPGIDEAALRDAAGRFHKGPDHDGRVCLVLGAGNVNSIPAADVLTRMFNEGKVCVLKTSPVNAYVGPLLEEAFAGAVSAGLLAVVHGGPDEGEYLASHPAVDEVHVTGSSHTHDLLVWGPPGPERVGRIARGEPRLAKPVTSELGNVTPVLVVPGRWTDRELAYQADDVAGMVTHNASFNCIAGKVLVLPRGWRDRERFLGLVRERMARTPARLAWYPGAEQRYRAFVSGRSGVTCIGGGEGALPWTMVTDLDPEDAHDAAFRSEPFCSVVFETQVGSGDPIEFLDAAVRFSNERLWGTLSATLLVSGATGRDPATAAAVDGAVRALRYGAVCVNLWPGMAFATGTLPWGAYPGAALADVQSGRGFVHNTRMLEHVEKAVLRGPAWSPIKQPWFPSHRTAHVLGRRLTRLQEQGSLRHLPGVVAAALRG